MTGAVDWHAHWIPPEVTALFEARSEPPAIVRQGGVRVFLPGDGGAFPLKDHQLDIGLRLSEMDAAGVERQVLSLAVLYGAGLDRLPADAELQVVRAFNDGLARLVAARGDRFSGLAALPVHDLAEAPALLEHAMRRQGLLGAVLPAEAFATRESARRYEAVFAAAARLKAHLFIHPGAFRAAGEEADEGEMAAIVRRRAVRFQNDLTAAAVTFEYTDFLAPYPGLAVHLANLGGTLALLAERIAQTALRMDLPADRQDGRLRAIMVDTASFGPGGIALAWNTLGPGRLLLGSDSPALPLAQAVRAVEKTALAPSIRRAILAGMPLQGT